MQIIDGEILKMKCKDCGHKFEHMIGYGPVCPTPWLRKKILKEKPPRCPECRSQNVKSLNFLERLGLI